MRTSNIVIACLQITSTVAEITSRDVLPAEIQNLVIELASVIQMQLFTVLKIDCYFEVVSAFDRYVILLLTTLTVLAIALVSIWVYHKLPYCTKFHSTPNRNKFQLWKVVKKRAVSSHNVMDDSWNKAVHDLHEASLTSI